MIRVVYIFRKPGVGHSIETLFENIIKYLPSDIHVEKIYLPYHGGPVAVFKNLSFLRNKKISCDVYHITGDVNYASLVLEKNKCLLTVHDLGSLFQRGKGIKRRVLEFIWFKMPIRKCRLLVAISQKTYFELINKYPIAASKAVVITNCIDDSWVVDEVKIKSSATTALVIGTKKNKNLQRIAQAAKQTNSRLWIVGPLTYEQKQLLKNIDYENYQNLNRDELRQLFLNADFLLFPTLYEGFGLPIIEAQATGLPVITSNIEPVNTIAGNGAVKINPLSTNAIVLAINSLKHDYELRKKIILDGYENAQNYKCSKTAEKYAALYRHLVYEKSNFSS